MVKDLERNLRPLNNLKNKPKTMMKHLNSAITLGSLAYVSQGLALQRSPLITDAGNTEHMSSLDSNLVSRASDSTTTRVGNLMNTAVDMARAAHDYGSSWLGWYAHAVADATADLVSDAMSDVVGRGS